MADSSRTIMTDAGFALETRVRADETKMQFTRATISTDDHFSDTDDALAKLTELSNIQQDGKVTAVQVINTTTVYVQVDVNQAESKADYQMRSAALYAKDDDGTEVLYGVTVLQDPVFVHKDADGSYLGFGINTTVGRASNVVVVVDPANMVTQQVFESTMKNYYTKAEVDAKFVTDDDFASKLPRNIATTDAANTFAKSQTLAGGATDGAGNAIATTKDVSDGDATTLKSAKEYADTKVSGKADDSKVVHDNGNGTIQVNGNAITPADDSKVVHDNHDNTITANGASYDLSKSGLTSLQSVSSGSFTDLPLGTVFADATKMADGPDSIHSFTTKTFYSSQWAGRKAQIAIADSTNLMFFRTFNGNTHVWSSWTKLADDFKVAHLSGANNFDTVPTVNSNPLLLASSLPSDLARTGQDANFTGKLQKSGVDVATVDDVSAKQDKLDYTPANDANTFHRSPDTGAVTESGNFPGLQVKGVDVATAADLKSVEESAWREITNPAFQGSYLFRDNEDGTASLAGTIYFYNRSQQYNENDDYIVPMPDGYKATGVASEGSLMGFINDFSVSLQGLKAYFPGTALHLYTDLNQNRPLSIPLCSIISSSATGITSSPIVLKVVKTS
ncbi:pyocin knob domain-containing protein [Levilactobacillus brevis]